jgi:hypothetical protein
LPLLSGPPCRCSAAPLAAAQRFSALHQFPPKSSNVDAWRWVIKNNFFSKILLDSVYLYQTT